MRIAGAVGTSSRCLGGANDMLNHLISQIVEERLILSVYAADHHRFCPSDSSPKAWVGFSRKGHQGPDKLLQG